jgi:2-keto-4-pentenoate hydratase/2-oxohepta-3-ene-1,7-dioic acid hydratase in catechol pathway
VVPSRPSKEVGLVRLATLSTPSGPRLHVRARGGGYVDIAGATGDPRLAAFGAFVTAGPAALETARGLLDRDGREAGPADFGPAVPAPGRILCLGVNYTEHALEGGRAVPTWPETFVRGRQSVLGPYADLVKPALTEKFDYEGELGIVIGAGGRGVLLLVHHVAPRRRHRDRDAGRRRLRP